MDDLASPTAMRVEGYVDVVDEGLIRGWAWMPDQPDEVAIVELVAEDDRVLVQTPARGYRGDLESAGKRGGICGFEFAIPPSANGIFSLKVRSPIDASRVEGAVLLEGIVLRDRGDATSDDSSPFQLGGTTEVLGWLDRADSQQIGGWAHGPGEFADPLTLLLVDKGRVLSSVRAEEWRSDIEDVRQGDGRCGFHFDLPDALYDGDVHHLDVRLPDDRSILDQLLTVAFPHVAPVRASRPEPRRPPEDAPLDFSIIINFHNMHREAARTLMSLSRRLQRDVEGIAYEVVCIDNGSDPPMDADFVSAFGPEFRLVRPSVTRPSPCAALNEAAAGARGRWLAVMIDGAHLVSPGVLCEAHAALKSQPRAIVALRQWFIGGDQRWLSSVGYSRAHEDILFAKINWPEDGYRAFDIAAPMHESPNSWFDGMGESNCLFLPADLYREMGGFDEAFDVPGAGFANLDLFRRASNAADGVIALIGEASFHQYHGGTTTNVDDAEKDLRVRAYARDYEQIRGAQFANLAQEQIRLSGAIRRFTALTARQRTFSPAYIGVTDRVRPRELSKQFDEAAQLFVQGAYVETGRHLTTQWRGEAVGVAPSDLTDIQEALWRVKPEVVVMKDAAPGLVGFIASILGSLELPETRIVWVSSEQSATRTPAGAQQIVGDAYDPRTLHRIQEAVGDAERTLVLFQAAAEETLPVEGLTRYARYVSFDSYLIVLGTALGQPWLGYSRIWLHRAILRFINGGAPFVIDRTMNQHFVTTCPSGFLRRSVDLPSIERYDQTLDDLSGL